MARQFSPVWSPWMPASAGRRRYGISLVELLVVVAIVGALIALLIPAVQAARETARQSQCGNNLRQLALAAHGFEAARGVLPPNRIAAHHPSWLYLVLPYLELSELQWEGATHQSMYAMPVEKRSFVVPVYLCPTREHESTVVTLRADGVPYFPWRRFYEGSISDYSACKGARVAGESYVRYGVLNENGAIVHGIYDQFPEHAEHVTGWRGRVALADILDGASRTLMAGELGAFRARRRHAFNGDSTGGEWLGLLNPLSSGDGDKGLGSDHPDVIQFVFCDGSLRRLSPATELLVLEQLATRSGGEISNR